MTQYVEKPEVTHLDYYLGTLVGGTEGDARALLYRATVVPDSDAAVVAERLWALINQPDDAERQYALASTVRDGRLPGWARLSAALCAGDTKRVCELETHTASLVTHMRKIINSMDVSKQTFAALAPANRCRLANAHLVTRASHERHIAVSDLSQVLNALGREEVADANVETQVNWSKASWQNGLRAVQEVAGKIDDVDYTQLIAGLAEAHSATVLGGEPELVEAIVDAFNAIEAGTVWLKLRGAPVAAFIESLLDRETPQLKVAGAIATANSEKLDSELLVRLAGHRDSAAGWLYSRDRDGYPTAGSLYRVNAEAAPLLKAVVSWDPVDEQILRQLCVSVVNTMEKADLKQAHDALGVYGRFLSAAVARHVSKCSYGLEQGMLAEIPRNVLDDIVNGNWGSWPEGRAETVVAIFSQPENTGGLMPRRVLSEWVNPQLMGAMAWEALGLARRHELDDVKKARYLVDWMKALPASRVIETIEHMTSYLHRCKVGNGLPSPAKTLLDEVFAIAATSSAKQALATLLADKPGSRLPKDMTLTQLAQALNNASTHA